MRFMTVLVALCLFTACGSSSDTPADAGSTGGADAATSSSSGLSCSSMTYGYCAGKDSCTDYVEQATYDASKSKMSCGADTTYATGRCTGGSVSKQLVGSCLMASEGRFVRYFAPGNDAMGLSLYCQTVKGICCDANDKQVDCASLK